MKTKFTKAEIAAQQEVTLQATGDLLSWIRNPPPSEGTNKWLAIELLKKAEAYHDAYHKLERMRNPPNEKDLPK